MKPIVAIAATIVALTATANPVPWSPVFKPHGDHYIVSKADKEAFDRWVQGFLEFQNIVKSQVEQDAAIIEQLKTELIRRGGNCKGSRT